MSDLTDRARELAADYTGPYKIGREYLPYHRSASHVPPDYRDGWNAGWWAQQACLAEQMVGQKPIPILAGKQLADEYGYDQVVIIGRRVGGSEHVTTYGRDKANCDVAARIGYMLKHKVMGWPKPDGSSEAELNAMALADAAEDLLRALQDLDACYCEASDEMSRAQRDYHRKVLVAVRAAVAKATRKNQENTNG